ncbi:MAG: hypothetical protein WC096_05925 [Sphaerochaetaceae bacterium]
MAVYEINGARYELPDDLQGDHLNDTLMHLSILDAEGVQQPLPYQYGPIREDIDPSTLAEDKDWLEASRVLYRMNTGKDWQGSDADLAEYGLDLMGWFNYNLPAMAVQAAQVRKAEQYQKEAFLYLMDSYDNLEMSWGGTGRFFKGVLSDPTTYIGLGTLGLGTAAAQGGKAATKEGIRALLRQGLRTGLVAGVEGGMYAGVDNTLRQSVEVSAGRKEEIDDAERLKAVGLGVGIGLVGGTVLDVGVNRAKQLFTHNRVVDASTEAKLPVPHDKIPRIDADPQTQRATRGTAEVEPEAPSSGPDVSTEATNPDTQLPATTGGLPTSLVREPDDIFEFVKLEDLPLPSKETTIPYQRQRMAENVSKAMRLAQELKNLHHTQIDDIVEQLRTKEMTLGEFEEFALSAKLARDWVAKERAMVTAALHHAKKPEEVARLAQKEKELGDLFSRLESMDEALGSHSGYMLRQRQEGLNLKRLPKDDPEEFARQVFKAEEAARIKLIKQDYDRRIERALLEGDIAEAGRLTTMRNIEVDAMLENELGKEPGFIRKLNELVISNVFSSTTLMVNLIPSAAKMLYRPALDALLSNPLEAAARKEMVATYSAMATSIKSAWRGALAAFRYEQAILTRESGRLLEGELAIKGKKGAAIRIFPRLLNASDEFLSQMTYQGFIAGRTAAEAYEAGLKQGLKGKALDRFVKERAKEAVEKAYADVTSEESIRTVANKGVTLGYSGEKLANYVKRELMRNPEALRHGHDSEAINYVRDVLYKRAFSGEGTASKAALRYEQLVNDFPALRLLGQLFFRTPVRVFEEGVRMTPGLQIVAPNFLKDLRGVNGRRAQMRAQGEAMMSLAFTGTVLSLYAQGRITGDGAYSDWRQQRARTDSDLPEPYTLILEDGSTWSFRNFDPLATPVKIIVNALERYENLATRHRQGEFITKTEWDKVLAAISVGAGAIAQAFRDANLMSGLDGAIELAENMADPEGREGAGIKYMGEKLRMLVPNTLHKIAKSNDPTIDDPATFWQMVESRLLGGASLGQYSKTVPKSYDVLGNVRQINDTGALWNIFSNSTLEERQKGRSEQELRVLRQLDFLSKQTRVTFQAPYRHPMMGDVDLRSQMTGDGKETLYDRWNRYYKEMAPEQILAPILDAGAPVGTKSIKGVTVDLVQSTINQLRDAAFYRLMSEEIGVTEQVIQNLIRKSEVQSGFWDQPMR